MGGDPGAAARERRERQAAALRANLRRRKQQVRARDVAARSEDGPAEPDGAGQPVPPDARGRRPRT